MEMAMANNSNNKKRTIRFCVVPFVIPWIQYGIVLVCGMRARDILSTTVLIYFIWPHRIQFHWFVLPKQKVHSDVEWEMDK